MRATIVLALCCAFSIACHAEIYKWVDADGKVQYSDQKPPAAANARTIAPPPPPADPDAARRMANQQVELKKAADAEEQKRRKGDQDATSAKQKEELCTNLRGQLQELRAGGEVFRYNSKGEREIINNDQALHDLEQRISNTCSA